MILLGMDNGMWRISCQDPTIISISSIRKTSLEDDVKLTQTIA